MNCVSCGKEIQEEWIRCPYCGMEVQNNGEKQEQRKEQIDSNKECRELEYGNEKDEELHDFGKISKGNLKKTGRLIVKILALIAIVCFFCPVYLFSCESQELFTVTGMDMTFGFECMGEKIDGLISFGMLFILPLLSLGIAFVNQKKLKTEDNDDILRVASYINAICGLSATFIASYFTIILTARAEETSISVRPKPALIIMIFVNLITAILGTYMAYQYESTNRNEESLKIKNSKIRTGFKVLIGGILVFFISMLPIAQTLRPSTNPDDYLNEAGSVEQNESVDISGVDMEALIGKPVKEIEELGFVQDEEGKYYYNGDVCVGIDDTGKVDYFVIEGDKDKAPVFRNVELGMEFAEAIEALSGDYDIKDQTDDKFTVANFETRDTVMLEKEGDQVVSICYMKATEEKMAELKAKFDEGFIFPDSDKKYLSEDEVRSVTADKLFIGRNEIFARHGRMFDTPELAEYFAQQSWYEGTIPADQFDNNVLNDFEKKNVELIQRIEDEINGVGQFIGQTGVYVSTAGSGDYTGRIEILSVGDSSVQFRLGTLEYSSDILIESAQIIDNKTAQMSSYGFTITLQWMDSQNIYVTTNGNYSGMEAGVILDITSGQHYTWAAEFNTTGGTE